MNQKLNNYRSGAFESINIHEKIYSSKDKGVNVESEEKLKNVYIIKFCSKI